MNSSFIVSLQLQVSLYRTLGGSLAERPELVNAFLSEVSERLSPLAKEDYDTMQIMKNRGHSDQMVSNVNRKEFYILTFFRFAVFYNNGGILYTAEDIAREKRCMLTFLFNY